MGNSEYTLLKTIFYGFNIILYHLLFVNCALDNKKQMYGKVMSVYEKIIFFVITSCFQAPQTS